MNDTPLTQASNLPRPPEAARRPCELTMHGHTRVDEYYWLRERHNEEVTTYLQAENEYTRQGLAHTEALQQRLYDEMVGRTEETDQTVPVKIGDYFYYSRTEQGLEYRIHCRRAGSTEAPEQQLLNLNELARQHDFLKMGAFKVSPDHNILAYSLDTDGSEAYTIHFKDLRSGRHLADKIEGAHYSAEWAADSTTFFYTTFDHARRSDKVWRHRLGAPQSEDQLQFHELDEIYNLRLYKTKDRAFLVLLVRSLETSEVYFLPAAQPQQHWTLVEARSPGVRYHIEHHDGRFFIVTNLDAPNFQLLTAPVAAPSRANWQEVLGHRPNVMLEGIELFARHLVLYEREDGLRRLRAMNLQDGRFRDIPFPEPVYTFAEHENPEFDSHLLRITYHSLTTPETVYDVDLDSGERHLKKQQVVSEYAPGLYQSERIYAASVDGVQVPISLVYRADLFEQGKAMPCLLYGYGAYGAGMEPGFSSTRISLLDRGFIWAIAHIRGGAELGRAWYDQGKFLNKRNTFEDFIACARRLIDGGYTAPDRLAIMGRSAGGLLIGAVLNMAPELFRAAMAGVPFVDVVTTMLDESIPLTVGEFEEWGNPKDREYYDYLLSYSPYDNVSARDYPEMLVTAGLNDPRVQYWEPAKWVARLRAHWKGPQRLFLRTEMGAGHAGPSGRYESLREVALYYAFLLDSVDASHNPEHGGR